MPDPRELPVFGDEFPIVSTLGVTSQRAFMEVVGEADWVVRPVSVYQPCYNEPKLTIDQIVDIAKTEHEALRAVGIPTVAYNYGWIEQARCPQVVVPSLYRSYKSSRLGKHQLAALVQVVRPSEADETQRWLPEDYMKARESCITAQDAYYTRASTTGYELWDLDKGNQYVPYVPETTSDSLVFMLVDIEPRIRIATHRMQEVEVYEQ